MMVDPKCKSHSNQPEPPENTPAAPDADNNLGRGAPADRKERIDQMAREKAQTINDNPQYEHRKAHDLDREDCELHRQGAASEKTGVRPSRDVSHTHDKD